jgi:hypothetical protein
MNFGVYAGLVPVVAPVAVPAGALLLAKVLGASWPLAMMVGIVAIPIVWFVTHQDSFGA